MFSNRFEVLKVRVMQRGEGSSKEVAKDRKEVLREEKAKRGIEKKEKKEKLLREMTVKIGLKQEEVIHDANGGVVGVAIQYRLGVFGFLSSQKVHDGGVLNAGLCESHSLLFNGSRYSIPQTVDQRFALQWVQQHVGFYIVIPS